MLRFGLSSGLFCLGLALIPLHAQTLDDAIFAALETNPTIDRARFELRASREQLPQARAQFRSQVTLQSSISATDRDARLTDGQDFTDTAQPYSASIRLTRPIYTGGLKPIAIRRARLSERSQRFRYQDEEVRLALNVIDAFYNVLSAQERLQVQSEVKGLIFDQIRAAEERFRLDVGTVTDVSQVKARYAASTSNIITAQTDLIRTRSVFETVTGLTITELIMPEQTPLPAPTLSDAIALAKDTSPTLKALRAQYDIGRMDVLAAARRNRPQVSLNLEATTARDSSPAIERDDDIRATLSVSIPLSDGGASRSQRREALAIRNSVSYAYREQELQLELFVTDLWLQIEAAEAEIIAQRERLAASELALEGIIQGQTAGLWTTTDILDATEQVAVARLGVLDVETGRARLLRELSLICGANNP